MELTRRTVIVAGAILLTLVLLSILFVGIGRRGSGEAVESATPEYFDRELVIDEIEYEMPDPAAVLLEPRLEFVVDPEEPFPDDTARELQEYILQSLHDTLTRDLEEEIERLIRDH